METIWKTSCAANLNVRFANKQETHWDQRKNALEIVSL